MAKSNTERWHKWRDNHEDLTNSARQSKHRQKLGLEEARRRDREYMRRYRAQKKLEKESE